MPRFYCAPQHAVLTAHAELDLPPNAARHVQVLRMQPGAHVELFDGTGGAWQAEVLRMTRNGVAVRVLTHQAQERELQTPVHVAVGLPANERMDWLVEKATELGVASVQPLITARSVLRLPVYKDQGELEDARSSKKRQHWQGVAQAACEQCGRNRVPVIAPVRALGDWLAQHARAPAAAAYVLQPPTADAQSVPLLQAVPRGQAALFLIGPEGGLSAQEVQLAQEQGFVPCHLGARILRAETAPLAVLAALAAREAAA